MEKLLYLAQQEVAETGLTMSDVIATLEEMFLEMGEGRVEMPPKPGIHPSGDAFIHAMPAYIPSLHAAGIKWVSAYPQNRRRGLPYISGLLILNDPDTGMPLCVMDAAWITAKRTGAATAISAKHLARPDSKVAGILGCGVQGRSNLEAITSVFPLERVIAYDPDRSAAERYSREMTEELDLEVVPADEPRSAVSGCDIVVTAGPILKVPHATIKAGWLDEGAFASAIDFDSYWDKRAMHEVDKFCTDDTAQFTHYQGLGLLQGAPVPYADLGNLVSGKLPGRCNDRERTMSCNLGLAAEDMVIARRIYDRAVDKGLGTKLPL